MCKTRRFVYRTALLFAGLLTTMVANAQTQKCFTLASLKGNYGIVATYGANVALALATRSYDGNGNLSGTFVLNEPTTGSSTGARTIVSGTQAGTYTVNCNGSGQFSRLVVASNGVSATQVDDFVITGAAVINGVLVATAIADAAQVPSAIVAGGVFVIRAQTRLPDFLTY